MYSFFVMAELFDHDESMRISSEQKETEALFQDTKKQLAPLTTATLDHTLHQLDERMRGPGDLIDVTDKQIQFIVTKNGKQTLQRITHLDTYVYTDPGTKLPPSRQIGRSDKEGVAYLNAKDASRLFVDTVLAYINIKACTLGSRYEAKDLKYGFPLSFSLVADGPILRISVRPSPQLSDKYVSTKKPSNKHIPTSTSAPVASTPDVQPKPKIILPREGDDNEPRDAHEIVREGVTDISRHGLHFEKQLVRGVVGEVYGVPEELVGKIKVVFEPGTKTFLIYKENKLINQSVGRYTISEIEEANKSVSVKFSFFGGDAHHGFINGEIDSDGVLRVFRGDKTRPGYEFHESPTGRHLPFVPSHDTFVSSNFEDVRTNGRIHHAIDIRMPVGTKILAVSAGKITKLEKKQTGYGRYVLIDHGNGYITRYAHLSQIGVHVGDTVTAGQEIGLSGDTGSITGPHLHFDIKRNGKAIDPALILNFSTFVDKNRNKIVLDPKNLLKSRKPGLSRIEKKVGATQVGQASWYNDGAITASGEKFDKDAMTAAHNTLPFGTIVKITNLTNGKIVHNVRINDTGGFGVYSRIIDVTEGVAKQLDMIQSGVTNVRIDVVKLGSGK